MKVTLSRVLKRLLKSALFVFSVVLFVALILIGTESGTSWLISRLLEFASENSGMRLSATDIKGSLIDEIEINDLTASSPESGFSMSAGQIFISWNQLALFDSTLDIRRLDINNLFVVLPQTVDDPQNTTMDIRPILESLFTLPLQVRLRQFELTNITLRTGSDLALSSLSGNLQLDRDKAELALDATVDAQTAFMADLSLNSPSYSLIGDIDWQTQVGQWPAAGRLILSGDLAQLSLEHNLSAPTQILSAGTLRPAILGEAVNDFSLRHELNGLQGALFDTSALENLSGTLTTQGSLDQVRVTGNTVMQVAGFGDIQSDLDLTYSDAQIRIGRAILRGEQFTLETTGDVSLGDVGSGQLDWILTDFDDRELIPQIDLEQVNSRGAVVINTEGDQTVSTFRVDTLTGRLNGYQLTGSGNVSLMNDEIREVALVLNTGDNALVFDGSLTPDLSMGWEIQAPALEQVVPQLQGMASGRGTLTGTTQRPRVAGSFNAQNLAYNDSGFEFRLGSLAAQASYAEDNNAIALEYSVLQIESPAIALLQDFGELQFSGTLAQHDVRLQTFASDLSLNLAASGAYINETWRGDLVRADIASDYGGWQLQESVGLTAGVNQADIDSHCWQSSEIMLCGQAAWSDDTGAVGQAEVSNLPLAYFNDNLPRDLEGLDSVIASLDSRPQGIANILQSYSIAMPENSYIDGMLDVSAVFSGLGGEWSETTISAELAPRDLTLGLLRPPASEAGETAPVLENYGIDELSLALDRRDSQWLLESGLEIYLAESGGLDFQGNFAGDFSLADDGSLGGDFELSFNNIAWVEALLPVFRNASGELNASGSLEGNLERPLLLLQANLQAGSFEVPDYGLMLEEVSLAFVSASDNAMSITGSARSGEGAVVLDSTVITPFLETREVHLSLQGQKVTLMNLPGSRVLVDPDLAMDYEDNVLGISGSLHVPEMTLDFTDQQALANAGSVAVSRDVVIVSVPDGEQLPATTTQELIERIPVIGEVDLSMGDAVHFLGFGLDIDLTGSLLLEQSINRPLLAHGELSIPSGSYGLYGQTLVIENGKLLFLGNPLNPALDIRAKRQTRVAEVGVLMNGTVSNINAQLFSTPALPESEILSLLVTGNSFQNSQGDGNLQGDNMLGAIALLGLEKGQGLTSNVSSKLGIDSVAISSGSDYRDSAIGLGKYLSPNLFMRYDIGLFDRENALTLDYILTERLKLEVETGVSQSVDLTYTVEK